VTSTRKKLDGPVRNGEWGFAIDRIDRPSAVTILKFADKSRHTRSFSAISTFTFDRDLDVLVEAATTRSTMSPASARALARDLVAKIDSPRARGRADALESDASE
jgi:hypothetical protein